MKLTIQAFGIAKEILGQAQLKYEVPAGTDVGRLLASLKTTYPDFEKLVSLLVAVNEEYASEGQALQEADEIVLIPPVSGG